MVTENKETVPAEEAKPKIEESPEFREALQKAIRQGTSKYQQQAAAAKKSEKAAAAQVQAIQDELAQAREAAEVARLAGDDVDGAERVKRILQRERAAEKRWKEAEDRLATAEEYDKRLSMQTLHAQYGIPIADLEDMETLPEMKIAAVEYENTQLKKAQKPGAKAKVEDEERESKPLDTNEGRLGSTKIPAPGTKEFEDFYGKVKAGFSR